MKVKNKTLQRYVIGRKLGSIGISPDTVDLDAEIDPSLHLDENISQMPYFRIDPDYEAMEDDYLKQVYEEIYGPGVVHHYPPQLAEVLLERYLQEDPLLEDPQKRESWMENNMEQVRSELVLEDLVDLNKAWRAENISDLDKIEATLKKEGYNAERQFPVAWEAVSYFEEKRADYDTILVLLPPGCDPEASVLWRIPQRA